MTYPVLQEAYYYVHTLRIVGQKPDALGRSEGACLGIVQVE